MENIKIKKKIRNLRQKFPDNEEETSSSEVLEEARELQKLRERPHGVSAVSLATGKKLELGQEKIITDPFKTEAGGMIDMKALKSGELKQNDDAYSVSIGTHFSAETNVRDEDEEMKKFVDMQLALKRGSTEVDQKQAKRVFSTAEEAAFHSLPDFLGKSSNYKSEEMLSSQMLTGIPEVDLGVEVKIKNIEATEEAKQRMLAERMKKKDAPSEFVPTNVAANFVKTMKLEPQEEPSKKKRHHEQTEKATDHLHYEKFKKQFKR
ncbi:splicing factor C9orf78-like [Artemia franciscana]